MCSGGGGLVGSFSSQRGIYKIPEGPCRDHGEKGVRECGHPFSCVAGRFLELQGNKAPRHGVSELETCNHHGEMVRTKQLNKDPARRVYHANDGLKDLHHGHDLDHPRFRVVNRGRPLPKAEPL